LLAGNAAAALAADLPAPTKKMLADLKMDQSILSGLDDELAVPAEWVEAAKKEGAVRIGGSWDPNNFKSMTAAFAARYPYIKVSYSRGSFQSRVITPLMAAKEGRYVVDVVASIGGALQHYFEADLLEDLNSLPGAKNVPVGMKDPKGRWIGMRLRHWCLAYNVEKVKKSELPATWDDLLNNPRWRNGKIGMNNLPQVWLLPLWGEFGESWGANFTTKLFQDVRPQIRKEGANALAELLIAGEFDVALPAGDHHIGDLAEKGAPISWHCPTPVPSALGEITVLKGSPNADSGRIFANWLLSKEGQIAQYEWEQAIPVHKDLQLPVFEKFPDEILDKKIAFREPSLAEDDSALLNVWNPLWEQPH
jgi:iron(III) transport system substrate-binding protein